MAAINNMLKSALFCSLGVLSLCSDMVYSMERDYIFRLAEGGKGVMVYSPKVMGQLPHLELSADLEKTKKRLLPTHIFKVSHDGGAVLQCSVGLVQMLSLSDLGLPDDALIGQLIELDKDHIALNATNGELIVWNKKSNQKVRSIVSPDGKCFGTVIVKDDIIITTREINGESFRNFCCWETGEWIIVQAIEIDDGSIDDDSDSFSEK